MVKALNDWINLSRRKSKSKAADVEYGEELPIIVLARELSIISDDEQEAYLKFMRLFDMWK